MKNIFVIISMFLCVSLWGQNPLQQSVDEVAGDPTFAQAVVGVCVMDNQGNIVAGFNQEKMLVPASNMKLISTGAALYRLSPDYRFSTEIAHDGKIEDGVLMPLIEFLDREYLEDTDENHVSFK